MGRLAGRLDRRRVFRELIGPGVLLALYCAVLMTVLPSGINRTFLIVLALIGKWRPVHAAWLIVSAILLAFFTIQFASWLWVA